jgi:hypothetical protein
MPTPEHRIRELQKLLPRAQAEYRPQYVPVQMDTERASWEAYSDFTNPPEPQRALPTAEDLNAPVVHNPYGRSWLASDGKRR